jgi:hypothetical protein
MIYYNYLYLLLITPLFRILKPNIINGNNPMNKYLNKKVIDRQNIILNKKKDFFLDTQKELYLHNNEFIADKKIISISPGGMKGFYLFGISSYIKKNYKLDNYVFSGASAGAWNSLFMCFKKNPSELIHIIMNINFTNWSPF